MAQTRPQATLLLSPRPGGGKGGYQNCEVIPCNSMSDSETCVRFPGQINIALKLCQVLVINQTLLCLID